MIKDNIGNLLTDKELFDKSINEVQIDVKSTEAIMARLDEIIVNFDKISEYQILEKKLNNLYSQLLKQLKPEDKGFIDKIDKCFTQIVGMIEEYFYVEGHRDGMKSKET